MNAGDLAAGREYVSIAVDHYRNTGQMSSLAITLRSLDECLGQLGQIGPARDAAAEALASAQAIDDFSKIYDARCDLGWLAGLAGDTAEAEQQFIVADQLAVADTPESYHLYSLGGIRWAAWLARTGRDGPAKTLTERNAEISRTYGWNATLARCDWVLGYLALMAGDTAQADERLAAAAGVFGDGDYLPDLAITLSDLANCSEAIGDLDAADRHATETITIAAPRGLVPAQATALAVRACIRANQAAAGRPDLLHQGRDAADAALRLATRHQLAWHELDALHAHAALDRVEGADRGWAARSRILHARLVPPGLDPDPLGTVERLVATPESGRGTARLAD